MQNAKGCIVLSKGRNQLSNGTMEKSISLIIPNYNGSSTIGKCLTAAFTSRYGNFEVVVVDDCSADNSVEIIRQFPVRLITFEKHAGASSARNRGAEKSRGEILFFIDADCLIRDDALSKAANALASHPGAVIGGTYTPLPFDTDFFSVFQSLFIHYSETKKKEPDYIAAHALIIDAGVFRSSGGFPEDFLPILEDVEFSHRLRRNGVRLLMAPEIQVTHVFNFTAAKALRNAFRKTMYWTLYSLANRDLLADSGTASVELKINGLSFLLNVVLVLIFLLWGGTGRLIAVPIISAASLFVSRRFFALCYRKKGLGFTASAALFYVTLYPLAIIAGGLTGTLKHALFRAGKKVILW